MEKAYLSARVARTSTGIEYRLDVIDARFGLPTDEFVELVEKGQGRFFSPPALTEAEKHASQKQASGSPSTVSEELGEMFVHHVSTERLEEELLRRLLSPPDRHLSGIERALVEAVSPTPSAAARRPPSAALMRKLQRAIKDSSKPPSTRSGERRTPSPRRASSARRPRGRPSRSAEEHRGKRRAS